MNISRNENIYFSDLEEREKVLNQLESDFDELKAKRDKLKVNPDSCSVS